MPSNPASMRHPFVALCLPLVALGLVVAALAGDRWAFVHLDFPGIYDLGWGRLLRVAGYLPTWLLIGVAIHRSAASRALRRQAVLLAGAPTASGALSELLKLIIRRERPGPNAGAYVFRSFADRPFSTSGFGMPSGDVVVAFAACAILARVWPRARILWYGLAIGCALGRVLSHAHFLSDVTVAAILGWGVAELLWRRYALPADAVDPSAVT